MNDSYLDFSVKIEIPKGVVWNEHFLAMPSFSKKFTRITGVCFFVKNVSIYIMLGVRIYYSVNVLYAYWYSGSKSDFMSFLFDNFMPEN